MKNFENKEHIKMKKSMVAMKTAHYSIDRNRVSREEIKKIIQYLNPNKKYGTFLRDIYFSQLGDPRGRLSKWMQSRILLQTPEGTKRWNAVSNSYFPVPSCIPSNQEVILPHSFEYQGHLHSASAVFNIKLQLLIKQRASSNDGFVLSDDDIKYLGESYKRSNFPIVHRAALNSNLEKKYFYRVEGTHNLYRFSKENEHIYRYLLKGSNAPQESPYIQPKSTHEEIKQSIRNSTQDGFFKRKLKKFLTEIFQEIQKEGAIET